MSHRARRMQSLRGERTRAVRLHARRYFVIERKVPIRHFLYLDFTCFLLVSLVVVSWLLAADAKGTLAHGWQWRAMLTGARIGYSLCAFPFFFVSVPPWKYIFTHAKETGYNRHGRCVPKKRYKEFDWVTQQAKQAVDCIEAAGSLAVAHNDGGGGGGGEYDKDEDFAGIGVGGVGVVGVGDDDKDDGGELL